MYLSYKIFLFFSCQKPEAAGEIIFYVCESPVQLLARAKKHTYLTLGRYICISLLGAAAAAAEDDSVKMLLGNIRISALQTVGSQLMAEKCE